MRRFVVLCAVAVVARGAGSFDLFGVSAPSYTSKEAASLALFSSSTGKSKAVAKLTALRSDGADALQAQLGLHAPSNTALVGALKRDLSGTKLYAIDAATGEVGGSVDVDGGISHLALRDGEAGLGPTVYGVNEVRGVPRFFEAPALNLSAGSFKTHDDIALPARYSKEGLNAFMPCSSKYTYAVAGAIVTIDVAAASGGAGNTSMTLTKCAAADDLGSLHASCTAGRDALYGVRQATKGTDIVRIALGDDACTVTSLSKVDAQYDVAVPSAIMGDTYVATLVDQSGVPHLGSFPLSGEWTAATASPVVELDFAPIAFVPQAQKKSSG